MHADTSDAERAAWLILLRAPGLGPAGLRRLVGRYGTAAAALAAACTDSGIAIDATTRAALRAPDRAAIDADLRWLDDSGHALIVFTDADFPPLLHEAAGAPAALFVSGVATAMWQPQVAIVGSRNASHGGLATAAAFARALAQAGFAITSGLAEGIDGAAHAAALDAGAATIAVLGTGPDRVYPARHAGLAERIRANGALVSEFPPGTPAHPAHFPRRNRLIAGLGLGTLVVEAGLRSGSLITARHASEAGREVFAIPGSIHNPLARGCHQLIRDGARLVETAEEIVAGLAPLAGNLGAHIRNRLQANAAEPACTPDDPERAALIAAIGSDTVGMDQIAERTGRPVAELSPLLLILELEGAIVVDSGLYSRRVRST